jgi:hypothetical protein
VSERRDDAPVVTTAPSTTGGRPISSAVEDEVTSEQSSDTPAVMAALLGTTTAAIAAKYKRPVPTPKRSLSTVMVVGDGGGDGGGGDDDSDSDGDDGDDDGDGGGDSNSGSDDDGGNVAVAWVAGAAPVEAADAEATAFNAALQPTHISESALPAVAAAASIPRTLQSTQRWGALRSFGLAAVKLKSNRPAHGSLKAGKLALQPNQAGEFALAVKLRFTPLADLPGALARDPADLRHLRRNSLPSYDV